MNLIDRYVAAVMDRLPSDIKEDVGRELRTNIEDMLPENYTESDVYAVLQKLGSPKHLAGEYNPKKKYLIGPVYYDSFIFVLKLVVGICTAVFACIVILDWAINTPFDENIIRSFGQLFGGLFSSVFEGALQAAFWVTMVFFIMERCDASEKNLPFSKGRWTPDELKEEPVSKNKKISRGETVFSMIWTVLFVAIVYFKPQLVAAYIPVDDRLVITPVFNLTQLQGYLFIILAFAIIQLALFVWKFITQRWTLPIAIAHVLYNGASCFLMVVMLRDNRLFNSKFFVVIADIFKVSVQNLLTWLNKGVGVFIIIVILLNIIDSVSVMVKGIRK